MDTDDVVNHCSGAYAGGMVTGMVFQMVLAPEASEAEAAELESEAELLEEAESVGCFVAGTKVLTKEGEKPIDQIRKGDKVWSRDPDTGQFGWKTVTDTIVHYNKPVLRLQLIDTQGHAEVLGVTGNHPFWVRNRGWTRAEDLLDGDEVFSSRGGWVKVGSASWFAHSQTVYNLEVDGFHTYFVGASGAWVHNSCFGATTEYLADTGVAQRSDEGVMEALSEDGVELSGQSPDGRFKHFQDAHGRVRARIDPPDSYTDYRHLHLYDEFGSSLDELGRIVERTSPEAHIPLE